MHGAPKSPLSPAEIAKGAILLRRDNISTKWLDCVAQTGYDPYNEFPHNHQILDVYDTSDHQRRPSHGKGVVLIMYGETDWKASCDPLNRPHLLKDYWACTALDKARYPTRVDALAALLRHLTSGDCYWNFQTLSAQGPCVI